MGKKQDKKRRQKRRKAKHETQADRADVYRLYEAAVQDPEGDAALVRRIYKSHFDREPLLLREDFCGTAAFASAWVRHAPDTRAWGVDLDPKPLAWGKKHHVRALEPDAAARLELIEANVLDATCEPVDVTVAFNFSYFVFQERAELQRYFEKARSTLGREGLFVLDLYGGAEAQITQSETREEDGFDYVWDQDMFDPINHGVRNFIHFEFDDGSRIERAFRYDWRLWTIPEVRDVLLDAGFSSVEAYWEKTDKATNEGTGVYYCAKRAIDDPAWVAYVAALP